VATGREYSKVFHTFWTGDTGRRLREQGPDAQRVAFYLITCASANMIGLYYLPLPLLCHELALTKEGASKALRRVAETGFGYFEGVEEVVFVPEMAAMQIGETLKTADNRHKRVVELWRTMRKSRFYKDFWNRYAAPFNLPDASPVEAPSKPLRSQEQEQEQEQEQKKEDTPPSLVITKSLRPKSIPIDLPVLGNFVCLVSTNIETKYSFVGVFDMVHCFIIPENNLCRIISIGSLNFGIFNFPSSSLTDCGTVKLFFECLDLNFGNPFLNLKKFLYEVSKFFKLSCNDCELISFNQE
jgi:hypothetical protein